MTIPWSSGFATSPVLRHIEKITIVLFTISLRVRCVKLCEVIQHVPSLLNLNLDSFGFMGNIFTVRTCYTQCFMIVVIVYSNGKHLNFMTKLTNLFLPSKSIVCGRSLSLWFFYCLESSGLPYFFSDTDTYCFLEIRQLIAPGVSALLSSRWNILRNSITKLNEMRKFE